MSATAHPGVVEIDLADANADANAVASRVLEVIDRARIVRVSGGSVSGSLDFIGVDAPTLLEFRNVSFSETPQFNDSRWRGLHLVGCHAPGIAIQRGVLDSLRMEECEFGGALDLDSAELRHGAGFREVRVDASSEWAIRGTWLRAGGSVGFDGLICRGMVDFLGASIAGELWITGADIGRVAGRVAVRAHLASLGGSLRLQGGVRGEVSVGHVTVNGDLDLRGLRIEGSPRALAAHSARVAGRIRCGQRPSADEPSPAFEATGEVLLVAADLTRLRCH